MSIEDSVAQQDLPVQLYTIPPAEYHHHSDHHHDQFSHPKAPKPTISDSPCGTDLLAPLLRISRAASVAMVAPFHSWLYQAST
jgi:hypothetical protein